MAMALQAKSERDKRSIILESEGQMGERINIAEGIKKSYILEGQGQAEQIMQEARSISESIDFLAKSMSKDSGDVLKLRLTEQYIAALGDILKHTNVTMLPESAS